MRISDWRSDVCSSDLNRLCGSYFESGGGAVRDNPFLDEAIEACSNGATLAPYALNNPALLLVLKTIRGDITPQDWDGFQKRLETVQMRSEEHTSELQSLMRISYAVFCVKKKKKQEHIQPTQSTL